MRLHILFYFQIVGGLIGKGGENIKNIRSACPDVSTEILKLFCISGADILFIIENLCVIS